MIRFFGTLPFAIVLIVSTLLLVIAGTFIESVSGSHLFAASLTYQNPVFRLLLWLYFINILFAALNRYPFKIKHIPFLLTHLGLLLLLLGVFVKNHFGVQGAFAIAEGSGSSDIWLPNSYALQIAKPGFLSQVPLKKGTLGPLDISSEQCALTLLEWVPHAQSGRPLPLPKKREEAAPLICLLATQGERKEVVQLPYDKYGQSFKWPILGGEYLIRFQSAQLTIPHHIRLHEAKQVNYPGTNQPYSYEAKISCNKEEAMLSMNRVYEKNGYRFYLANLITSASGANQVQIVVNYDPAKYYLTYPGAIILACGIVLLYLRKRYV